MATYLTNFSEYSTGSQPSDWTVEFGSNTWSVISLSGARGGRILRAQTNADEWNCLSWNDTGAPQNVELVCKFNSSNGSASTYHQAFFVRGQSSNAKGYAAVVTNNQLQIRRFASTDGTNGISLDNVSISYSANTWYWIRIRVSPPTAGSGARLEVKYWQDGTTEPSSWTVTATDTSSSAFSTGGFVGVGGYYGSETRRYDYVGIGTNGDKAPTISLFGKSASSTNVAVRQPYSYSGTAFAGNYPDSGGEFTNNDLGDTYPEEFGRYTTGVNTYEWTIDLGTPKTFNRARKISSTWAGTTYAMHTLEILTSNGGSTFTSQGSTGTLGTGQTYLTIDFANPITARYVRFRCQKDHGSGTYYFGGEGQLFSPYQDQASLTEYRRTSGSLSGSSSLNGALSVHRPLSGSSTGSSTLDGDIVLERGLAGSINATLTIDPLLSVAWTVDGDILSTSEILSATLLANVRLQGSLSVSSALDGAFTMSWGLLGTINGSSTVNGDVTVDREFDMRGDLNGSSNLSGNLTVQYALSGSIQGQSQTGDPSLTVHRPLAGSINGSSTVDGDLEKAVPLQGSSQAAGTTNARLDVEFSVEGSIQGTSTVDGLLTADVTLAGTFSASSQVDGLLSVDTRLQGQINGQSTLNGRVEKKFTFLDGTLTATSQIDGSLRFGWSLIGNVEAQSALNGNLVADVPISSIVQASSSVANAELESIVALLALLNGSSTVRNADLDLDFGLLGSMSGTSSLDGLLENDVSLIGEVTGASQVDGRLTIDTRLLGVINGSSSTQANLILVDERFELDGLIVADSLVRGNVRTVTVAICNLEGEFLFEVELDAEFLKEIELKGAVDCG